MRKTRISDKGTLNMKTPISILKRASPWTTGPRRLRQYMPNGAVGGNYSVICLV